MPTNFTTLNNLGFDNIHNTDLTTKCRKLSLCSVCFFVVLSALAPEIDSWQAIATSKFVCGILKNNWYKIPGQEKGSL